MRAERGRTDGGGEERNLQTGGEREEREVLRSKKGKEHMKRAPGSAKEKEGGTVEERCKVLPPLS